MKRKLFYLFLIFEAVLCIIFSFAREALPGAFTAAMAFPFEQIGLGLRALSLSGSIGNAIAILLYVAFCLVPFFALLLFRRKRKLRFEDALLIMLSALLFATVYMMINPGMIDAKLKGAAALSFKKALLGSVIYSALLGYIAIRVLRHFLAGDAPKLQRYMLSLLCVLNVLFVYLAFGACFGDLLNAFENLRTGNIGNEQSLGITYVFLVLQYLTNALPYVLDILVVFAALELLKELHADRYSEASVIAAFKLSVLCGKALLITIISNIVFNLLQLIFMKWLWVINTSVQIPLLSIAFLLSALLLAQYIRENKQLKDDNDMFI